MESSGVPGLVLNYFFSFEVRVEVTEYSWNYISFVTEKLICHWIPIHSPISSSHLALSQGHVINSWLISRPKHLEAGTWLSSSLAWPHVPNGRATGCKQAPIWVDIRKSYPGEFLDLQIYSGLHMSKKNKPFYVYML